jgi:hypothetical protein
LVTQKVWRVRRGPSWTITCPRAAWKRSVPPVIADTGSFDWVNVITPPMSIWPCGSQTGGFSADAGRRILKAKVNVRVAVNGDQGSFTCDRVANARPVGVLDPVALPKS